jgi:hypothetical protein
VFIEAKDALKCLGAHIHNVGGDILFSKREELCRGDFWVVFSLYVSLSFTLSLAHPHTPTQNTHIMFRV